MLNSQSIGILMRVIVSDCIWMHLAPPTLVSKACSYPEYAVETHFPEKLPILIQMKNPPHCQPVCSTLLSSHHSSCPLYQLGDEPLALPEYGAQWTTTGEKRGTQTASKIQLLAAVLCVAIWAVWLTGNKAWEDSGGGVFLVMWIGIGSYSLD